MQDLIYKPLQIGDTIGLITPSSPLTPGRLETGIPYLEKMGFKIKLGKNIQKTNRFLAGTDQERANDIMDFFQDKDVNAIMAIAGGYGSQRLLPLLNYDLIRHHPKLLTGFSDTTCLQLGFVKKIGLPSYTGFTFRDTANDQIDPLIHATLQSSLLGKPYSVHGGTTVHSGIVHAPLIAGNLECIIALLGTPYQPDFQNKILLVEDLMAEPFQIDCRLSQLALVGVFDQIAGMIFGEFLNCIAKDSPQRDGTIDDVINEWCCKIKVPCLRNFPYGHGSKRCVLPIGKTVTLDAENSVLHVT